MEFTEQEILSDLTDAMKDTSDQQLLQLIADCNGVIAEQNLQIAAALHVLANRGA